MAFFQYALFKTQTQVAKSFEKEDLIKIKSIPIYVKRSNSSGALFSTSVPQLKAVCTLGCRLKCVLLFASSTSMLKMATSKLLQLTFGYKSNYYCLFTFHIVLSFISRFLLFFKLFIGMGLIWMSEIIAGLSPKSHEIYW